MGTKIRLRRIIKPETNRTFLLALDHGLTVGPLNGIENLPSFIRGLSLKNVDGIILHTRGMINLCQDSIAKLHSISLIAHLSGSTSLSNDPLYKRIVCSVENANQLGADGVSVHINLGSMMEDRMLTDLGRVAENCEKSGMPLLIMIYPRGENIEDEYSIQYIAQAIRVAEEIGADIIKTNYPGDMHKFEEIMSQSNTPVVVAEGARQSSEKALFKMVNEALEAGASGVCFGRNIFQHKNPNLMIYIFTLLSG